jgi:hypothetical protein
MTSHAGVVSSLREPAQAIVDALDDLVTRASAIDWFLAALGLFVVIWIWLSVRAATRLGPIEVEALTHDSEDGVPVLALTGALRERLAQIGLPSPPSVPAGAPQADLIAAVEASGAPQGAFLARVLQGMPRPRPPEYKVSGVLVGSEPVPPSPPVPFAGESVAGPGPEGPCGLRFWVRPAREGTARLSAVEGCWAHAETIDEAACRVYRHISNDAGGAFPVWARWTDDAALMAYVKGCKQRNPAEVGEAAQRLRVAADSEPFNVLAALELTNLYEGSVPHGRGDPALAVHRARGQSTVLLRYLAVARDWPSLLEPRYRAGIVAAALANTCERIDPGSIATQLGLSAQTPAKLPDALRDLAAQESKAVLQLLKPWYTVLRHGRLRTDFEPKGERRRELKHAANISKHCLRVRRICGNGSPLIAAEIRYRSTAVSLWHLVLGRGGLGWEAYYNASCFDALLCLHLERLGASRSRRSGIAKRAQLRLQSAFRRAGGALSPAWVREDPDQAALQGNPEWWRLLERAGLEAPVVSLVLPPAHPGDPMQPLPRPWRDPDRRAVGWSALAGTIALLAAVGLYPFTGWLLIPVLFAVWRTGFALWESGRTPAAWRWLRGKARRAVGVVRDFLAP